MIDKIQHYLSLLFITLLALLQSLIFITAKAENNDLQVQYLRPIVNQMISMGDIINIQAILLDEEIDVSNVTFKVEQPTSRYIENFETQKQENGSYLSQSSWDTTNLTPGSYYITTLADSFDDNGNLLESYESTSQEFVLMSSRFETVVYNVDITSPENNQEVNGESLVLSATSEATLDALFFNISSDNYEETINAERYNPDGLSWFSNLDLTSLTNGDYTVSLSIIADDINSFSIGDDILFVLNNILDEEEEESETPLEENEEEEESETPPESKIELISPSEDSIIQTYSFQISLETNFDAENFNIELINTSNPAITTGVLPINRTDGITWVKVLTLDPEIFVNDEYTLTSSAINQVNQETITNEFSFQINLNNDDFGDVPPDEEITLTLYNPGSNLSESVILSADSNYSDLDVFFIILNSTDEEEISRLPSIEVDRQYRALLDTLDFENSNYYIYASTEVNENLILTDRILVTIFNEDEEESETPPEDEEEESEESEESETPPEDEEEESEESETPPEDEEGASGQEETIPSDIAFNLDTNCIEVGITDEEECIQFQAILNNLDDRCLEQSIYDLFSCEDYLNRLYIDLECQEADIINPEECEEYMLETYSSTVDCQLDNQEECNDILRENHLNHLVLRKQEQDIITEIVEPLKGRVVSLIELSDSLIEQDISTKVLPLQTEENILVINSQKEIVLENENILSIVNPAVLMLDTDSDGLPNDIEEYYGTDAYNADTDNDGYIDSVEIDNNYNPLDEGVLEQERSTLDKIILSRIPLEQPKELSNKINENFVVEEVDNIEEGTIIAGKAEPNSWITIYLYSSLPLVMTTKTDESGNWSYTIQNSLTDGHHKVYVTINDATGKIVKQSSALSFLIKEAKAVTADEYFDDSIVTDKVSNMLFYYIIAAIILISLGLGIILFVHKRSGDSTL